jgi:MFS superfamily sulfate permease-like transporter
LLPILGWLPGYRRDWLLPDILAGLAVWAVMVPEGMAYAGIVGVPPIMGLYTIVPPLIAYALLGTSRFLVVAYLQLGNLDRHVLSAVRCPAHGLGGRLHPDTGHAGIY